MLAAQAIPFSELSVTSSQSYTDVNNTFNGEGIVGINNDEHTSNFTLGWLTESESTATAGKWLKIGPGGTVQP